MVQQLFLRLPFGLPLEDAMASLSSDNRVTFVNVANATAKSFLIEQLYERGSFSNIFWASDSEEIQELELTASYFFPGTVHSVAAKLDAEGLYDLQDALADKKPHLFLFEDFDTLQQQQLPTSAKLKKMSPTLEIGATVKLYHLFTQLEAIGYAPAEDKVLKPGEFVKRGDSLFVFPPRGGKCVRVELFGDDVEDMYTYDQVARKKIKVCKKIVFLPCTLPEGNTSILSVLQTGKWLAKSLFIADDIEYGVLPETKLAMVQFTSFPQETEAFYHLNFFSVLPYYTLPDFITDMKERLRRGYDIVLVTKRKTELEGIMKDANLMWTEDLADKTPSTLKVVELGSEGFVPHSFQNNEQKQLLLTDREIWQFNRSKRQRKAVSGMNADLMMKLKPSDHVVHLDHGLARFDGIVQREVRKDAGTREYLKLQYAGNDKLFVPVEFAEKITKFVGEDVPRLTKLDSNEWQRTQKKVKAETERIAEDLLKLYAKRELAKGHKYNKGDEMMKEFVESFPYEPTPGQAGAWVDVQQDMESGRTMDRLVCGDVGFGKTEIAMRAAFKAFCNGKQVAFLSPITILAEQHYESFMKRVMGKGYGIRIALLSRFQKPAEQKKILADMEKGLVDIAIGTHRLLSKDIKFKDLGLLIIDEEQRFGVKQKERLKELRADVDLLTLTATPIPRTLNMSLNKLKDISTITTPPPGRLPVVTEVRKYGPVLIRDRILFEIQRGGQVYFLHNQVKTIESQAEQLRALVPEASFLVAHGQLTPKELEARIHQFKAGNYDVLIASTIIENGIDLANANTLIVNHSTKFGLSQLYQLRGRVGRSRTQAYAYFLYHGQKLSVDSRKRLRAIVEASELGSGFQIAMRDLEIRGAGEVLGASQSGAMHAVGVGHFMRMLNQTVERMKAGEISTDEIAADEQISVEVPLSSYIPAAFIPSADEKIRVYQELAAADSVEYLRELKHDLREDYGDLPVEVENLCRVIQLKLLLRRAKVAGVRVQQLNHKAYEIRLKMGKGFSPEQLFPLMQKSPRTWTITADMLKMQLPALGIKWYDDLVADILLLVPDTLAKTKKLNKIQKSGA